jgi:apolipoprotein N-acyltransferase
VFRDAQGSIHGAGVMVAYIPVLNANERNQPTFYNRHGDWFGWGCVVISAGALLLRVRRPKKAA